MRSNELALKNLKSKGSVPLLGLKTKIIYNKIKNLIYKSVLTPLASFDERCNNGLMLNNITTDEYNELRDKYKDL